MFAVLIESPHLDWRRDPHGCRYQVWQTPVEIAGPVRRLMALLRLRYAALDFAVDPAGRWWFLEINPNGQWLWIEHTTHPHADGPHTVTTRFTEVQPVADVWLTLLCRDQR